MRFAVAALACALAAVPHTTHAGSGVDLAARDTTCSPCTDFYRYANGGWLARTEIPADESSWGSFDVVAERARTALKEIAESAARTARDTGDRRGSITQKVGDAYAAFMDSSAIERAGMTPLAEEFARIDAVRAPSDLPVALARLHAAGVNAAFRFGAGQDAKRSESVIAQIGQGGLGLPDRDYYFATDARSAEIRAAYVTHVARMLALSGEGEERARAGARAVMDVETRLAAAALTRAERRDPDKTYHKHARASLSALTPHFSWDAYLAEAGASHVDSFNVSWPAFLTVVDSMVQATPLDAWRTYARWRVLDAYAGVLPAALVAEDFEFSGRTLQGTPQMLPRWRRAVQVVDQDLGEALGQLYVAAAFPPAAKERMNTLVRNLISSFREELAHVEWMNDSTRAQAIAKLDLLTPKIGYPDKWRDYGGLSVTRTSAAANRLAARRFEFARQLAKIGRPVDRTEWGMTPQTVNAYYNSSMNEIVFPAAILQPPFFDLAADDAVNYGAIGMVIGHEISHGFDDRGRKFDARGNLREWWTADDRARYVERAACVEKEFDAFVVQDSLHMNGKVVLGESIADLAGVHIAWGALQRAQTAQRLRTIDGYTPAQRFFLGFARCWGEIARPEAERLQITTDPHPLSRFRVLGVVMNSPEFADAFDCAPGSPMVRSEDQRCRIW